MISKDIRREHVVAVLRSIEPEDVPRRRRSTKFELIYEGRRYPPKYVVSLAAKEALGEELEPESYSGGKETNGFLISLGFAIERADGSVVTVASSAYAAGKREAKPARTTRRTKEQKALPQRRAGRRAAPKKPGHNPRCSECKNRIGDLLRAAFGVSGVVRREHKLKLPVRYSDYREVERRADLQAVYDALVQFRGHTDFVRSTTVRPCDFYVDPPGLIVELDEPQHFTKARAVALRAYADDVKLGFDRQAWIELSEALAKRDNDPPYRDEQRAWYDTVRDFAFPAGKTSRPTARLQMGEEAWCRRDPSNTDDVEWFKRQVLQDQVEGEPRSMSSLRVALVVPHKGPKVRGGVSYREKQLRKLCHAGEVDLVVHDEHFLSGGLSDAHRVARDYAASLGVPVLSGYRCSEGFVAAVYSNPSAAPGDSREHLYLKHTSARKLAYERKGYRGRSDPMFNPIRLGPHRLGVMICHDMFFGLVTAMLLERGASALVDLTGGNVVLKKWKTIAQARSIELGGAFLCTMALKPAKSGGGEAFVFNDGVEHEPERRYLRAGNAAGFAIYSLSSTAPTAKPLRLVQRFSKKTYSDILVALGSDAGDVNVVSRDGKVDIAGRGFVGHHRGWALFKRPKGMVGVLPMPLERIYDPSALYVEAPEPSAGIKHHIVVYYSETTPPDTNRPLAMARLRAIEHRIAACVMAGSMREVIKTNNYKFIQRLKAVDGVFGLNTANLGGTRVTGSNAIPGDMFRHYLALSPAVSGAAIVSGEPDE